MSPTIHAPHFDSGRALCGQADYELETFGQPVNCQACLELQQGLAQEMAEFESFSQEYYDAVGQVIQAALCKRNAEQYAQRAEQIRADLEQAAQAA